MFCDLCVFCYSLFVFRVTLCSRFVQNHFVIINFLLWITDECIFSHPKKHHQNSRTGTPVGLPGYYSESVSEQSPMLYRQVATEQGSRVKLCVLLFENTVGGSTGGVSDFTIPVKLQTSNNRLSIKEHTHSTEFYSLPSE